MGAFAGVGSLPPPSPLGLQPILLLVYPPPSPICFVHSCPPHDEPSARTPCQARLTKRNLISLRGGSSTYTDGTSVASTTLTASPNVSSLPIPSIPAIFYANQMPGDAISKAAITLAKEKEKQRRELGGGGGGEGMEGENEVGGGEPPATPWKEWGLVRPRKEKLDVHYRVGKKVGKDMERERRGAMGGRGGRG